MFDDPPAPAPVYDPPQQDPSPVDQPSRADLLEAYKDFRQDQNDDSSLPDDE